MPAFILTTQDPAEVYFEDPPATLMPLGDWLEQYRGQELVWRPEHYEGVGVWLRHGAEEHRDEWVNSAAYFARACAAAADRIAAGEEGALQENPLGKSTHIVFVPDGAVVRTVIRYDNSWPDQLLPTLPREELIANLRAEAAIAHRVAEIQHRVDDEINRVLRLMS